MTATCFVNNCDFSKNAGFAGFEMAFIKSKLKHTTHPSSLTLQGLTISNNPQYAQRLKMLKSKYDK